MSRGDIRRLGDRLRAVQVPTADDLELLQQVIEAHVPAMRQVEQQLLRMGFEVATSRPKSVGVILDKLRRQDRMDLARMDDMVGVRIVGESWTRSNQDEAAQAILRIWPDARQVDRRASPSHGYRALHLIPVVDGYRVEIQLRTRLQNVWAQVQEKFGDLWGRSLRYGGQPEDPEALFTPTMTRAQVMELMGVLATTIDAYEVVHDQLVKSARTQYLNPGQADPLQRLRETNESLLDKINRLLGHLQEQQAAADR